MGKVFALSALIHGKFKSDSEFAKAIGWTRQKLYKIVNGLKDPSLEEAIVMANGLEVSLSTIAEIFLQYKSPKGD